MSNNDKWLFNELKEIQKILRQLDIEKGFKGYIELLLNTMASFKACLKKEEEFKFDYEFIKTRIIMELCKYNAVRKKAFC